MTEAPLGLFAGYGIEIEYMIVQSDSLDVAPICDRLLQRLAANAAIDVNPDAGSVNELTVGPLGFSNELALHVIEMKTAGPAATLHGLATDLADGIRALEDCLHTDGARLLPGGMHPWMDPDRETRLWPHEQGPIYQAYNRIFDCRGHGWSNLQSVHLNLPFASDAEFHRLHSAIRVLLPILPALAASSPLANGRDSGMADYRMVVYRGNAARIPAITGQLVPEVVRSRADYQDEILAPMYAAIAPLDPEGVLQDEWLNSRGAIARFDRNAVEIRVLDTQEHPTADLALLAWVIAQLQELASTEIRATERADALETARLSALFDAAVHAGDDWLIEDRHWLRALGLSQNRVWVRDLAGELLLRQQPRVSALGVDMDPFEHILASGNLASRLRRSCRNMGGIDDHRAQRATWEQLADCLRHGHLLP